MMDASWESLESRPVPEWYEDAKLGLLILWGPYSVPAWAAPCDSIPQIVSEKDWAHWLSRNPNAEWYQNSMQITGSPTWDHHRRVWGRHARYDAFVRTFRQGLKDWDPAPLAEAAAQCGARYTVFSAKHHDGFLLWPSQRKNPHKRGWQTTRDIVGELARAVRGRGMRFGIYYSGGLDWTFPGAPIRTLEELAAATPCSRSYAAYADAHWHELISRYRPSILWNDIASPPPEDLLDLYDRYYKAVPDGLVNDRFGQPEREEPEGILRRSQSAVRRLFAARERKSPVSRVRAAPAARHADFRTTEYVPPSETGAGKWECVRAIGHSFAYNSAETDSHLDSTAGLVRSLVDTVARGGNLLLCVGPAADGSIPALQLLRLRGLGAWLAKNGEAIYGSRPWATPEGTTDQGIGVRFTRRGMTCYAILMGTPDGQSFVIRNLRPLPQAGLRILGSIGYVAWFQEGKDVRVRLTEPLRPSPAHVICITPQPRMG